MFGLGSLIGPVANLAGTWLDGHVAEKKAKTEAKIVTIKSEAKIKERQATGEIDWDIEMAKSSDGSWKDEWLTVIFTLPLLLLMFGEYDRVSDFFLILDSAPDWYQYLLGTIVAASFGFRGAAKFMGKK